MATQAQLNAIMTAESGGYNSYNYLYNTNPNYYTASGYYQITNTTWQNGAQLAGVDTSQYPTAISAPYSVQTQVASALIDKYGMQPWSGSKANTILNQEALGMNPQVVTGPQDGGGGGVTTLGTAYSPTANQGYGANGSDQWDLSGDPTATTSTTEPYDASQNAGQGGYMDPMGQWVPGSAMPGGNPGGQSTIASTTNPSASSSGYGYPLLINLGTWAQGLATWANQTLGAWATTAINYASRGGLMLLGIVLIIVALIFLMMDRKQVMVMAKTAAEAAAA